MVDPAITILGVSAVGVAAIFGFVMKKVAPVGPFIYAGARIQAGSNYMVNEARLRELTEASSLQQFINSLKDTEYADEVDALQKIELNTVHAALELSFMHSFNELVELSPKQAESLLKSYAMFMEAKVIKQIYKSKAMKLELEEGMVFPVGIIDEVKLRQLKETETLADMKVVMSSTPYVEVFSKEYETLEQFEVALDSFVTNSFVDTVTKSKIYEKKIIIETLNRKVDIMNILAMLKFRIRGLDKEKQQALLIDNKSDMSKRFKEFIEPEDLKGFVESFVRLPYLEALKTAFDHYEKDKSMYNFERELNNYYLQSVKDIEMHHTLGPYPLFAYLLKKEAELKNLFIVSRGIDAGFSSDEIRRMLI